MIIFFSLDFILIIIGILMFLGIGWATLIVSWLWSHALIVGIILLIIHILLSIGFIMIAWDNYRILGVISSGIRSIFAPVVVYTTYEMMVISKIDLGFSLTFNWILVFTCINAIECLFNKAIESYSMLKFIFFTFLGIAGYIILINMIRREGF